MAAQSIELAPELYGWEKALAFNQVWSEVLVAGLALSALLLSQLMLSGAIHDTSYFGNDGKLYQSIILTAFNFGGFFNVTNFTPIQGVGSQLAPLNVWANPAYWPFVFFSREVAADASAATALAIFMIGSYIMARCFDMTVVASAIAAQLCILLFAPTELLFNMPSNFTICPGSALVPSLHMVALGILVRIEPSSPRHFIVMTGALLVVLLYSVYADPLWAMFNGIAWAVPFAIVAFGSLKARTILIRCAALACCFAVLLLTGVLEYLYTLSEYTARVQFALYRPRGPEQVSALSFSAYMKTFYLACAVGWLLGVSTLRGRSRLLVVAATVSASLFVAYCVVYLLLLNGWWLPPVPLYVEHALFVLFTIAAVAGYWGMLRVLTRWGAQLAVLMMEKARAGWKLASALSAVAQRVRQAPVFGRLSLPLAQISSRARIASTATGLLAVVVLPIITANFAINDPYRLANVYSYPMPNEPELVEFFGDNVGLAIGKPFRGSTAFWTGETLNTLMSEANLWFRAVPTVNEYSQLVTPQALYFFYSVFGQNVLSSLNRLYLSFENGYSKQNWKGVQMLGVRYLIGTTPMSFLPDLDGVPIITLPHRPWLPHIASKEEDTWYIYELPHPNMGNYSPTDVVTAHTGDEMAAAMAGPNFDFTKQVVLSTPIKESLVPAHDMQLTLIRGGLHVSGKSDGTSLVILPYQFSNCWRAQNHRVRIVRANLMMTGVMFSGDLDTDIVFDYGLFSPGCRRTDLADMKRLELKIDLPQPHLIGNRLFPDWDGAWAKLKEDAKSLKLNDAVFYLPVLGAIDLLDYSR